MQLVVAYVFVLVSVSAVGLVDCWIDCLCYMSTAVVMMLMVVHVPVLVVCVSHPRHYHQFRKV